jgi:hypothetical protein
MPMGGSCYWQCDSGWQQSMETCIESIEERQGGSGEERGIQQGHPIDDPRRNEGDAGPSKMVQCVNTSTHVIPRFRHLVVALQPLIEVARRTQDVPSKAIQLMLMFRRVMGCKKLHNGPAGPQSRRLGRTVTRTNCAHPFYCTKDYDLG